MDGRTANLSGKRVVMSKGRVTKGDKKKCSGQIQTIKAEAGEHRECQGRDSKVGEKGSV